VKRCLSLGHHRVYVSACVLEQSGVGMPLKVTFSCRNCEALYQLVREEANPESRDRRVTCRACGAPFPGREGKFALKYFLLRKATRIQESRLRQRSVR